MKLLQSGDHLTKIPDLNNKRTCLRNDPTCLEGLESAFSGAGALPTKEERPPGPLPRGAHERGTPARPAAQGSTRTRNARPHRCP